ncbi:GGDEF domain-containing protein [Tsukamurella sp. 8J]|uniref:GGDEF domain-containing protein n=1 Tax=Tsukamurella sp. 8J TaxID=3031962 RepID=UPI0023BA09DC|nr:GGDEF domain-containing protein [Tsukamurella sp. 8J]MDF0532050.1 GGDEF domain-containing protein [Tsukamurella sp. 8J]
MVLLDQQLVRPGTLPVLMGVWVFTLFSVVIVLACRPVGDRVFLLLSIGGMAGIAIAALVMTSEDNGQAILTLLAAVPAMAAMHSRMRMVAAFLGGAVGIVVVYMAVREPDIGDMVLRLGASLMAIVFPTILVVSLRRSLERALRAQRELSRTDHLTGLLNRRGLVAHAAHVFAEAQAHGRGIGFLALDVDNFKSINDQHGHAYGDGVLARTARIIADHAGPRARTSRLGGEEFAVLIAVDDLEAIAGLAESIRSAVAADRTVTISIGAVYSAIPARPVADVAWCEPVVERLTAAADLHLYRAKQAGRDRVHAGDPDGVHAGEPDAR